MCKVCFVFNMAPKYVEASYCLFDKELDMKWCFGSNETDIKEMDHSLLRDVTVYPTQRLVKGYYLSGINEVAYDTTITHYVLLGEPGCFSMWSLPILIKRHNPNAKIFFWSHGWYGKESRLKSFVKKIFFKAADGVLLYGNHARNLMINEGFDARTLFTIHNSLNHYEQVALRETTQKTNIYKERFHNDYPVLTFIGRLTTVKRLDMLIEAVYLLKQRGENFNLVLVGDGSEKAGLVDQVNSLKLENNVWFYGACYDDIVNAELIYNADLCVAPGNVGLTAMHTMVYGTPVLTHNDFRWQMPEFEAIIDGETGCFFEKDNVESLCASISNWFKLKSDCREQVRKDCYKEIDDNWTPDYELNVLKNALKL